MEMNVEGRRDSSKTMMIKTHYIFLASFYFVDILE